MPVSVPLFDGQAWTAARHNALRSDVLAAIADRVDVKNQFNAVGDDIADDTVPFTNALAALPASGGVVYVPSGTYRVNAGALDLGLTKSLLGAAVDAAKIHIVGSGIGINIGVPGQTVAPLPSSCGISRLTVVGDGSGVAGSIAVRIIKCLFPTLYNVKFSNIEAGLIVDAGDLWVANGYFEHIVTAEVKYGILYTGQAGKQVNQCLLLGGYIGGPGTSPASAYGLKIDNQLHGGNVFMDTHLEGYNGVGSIGLWVAGNGDPGNVFIGCGSEACTINAQFDAASQRNLVIGFQEQALVTDNGIENQFINMANRQDTHRYIPYAASYTPDLNNAATIKQVDVLTGAMTVNNPTDPLRQGQHLYFFFQQDATGNRAVTFGTLFRPPASWTTANYGAANTRFTIEFVYDSFIGRFIAVGTSYGMAA